MLKTTTIKIDQDTAYTARQTQIAKLRGGFSEYVELLILADLAKKRQPLLKYEERDLPEDQKTSIGYTTK